jgi:hypothetical protein
VASVAGRPDPTPACRRHRRPPFPIGTGSAHGGATEVEVKERKDRVDDAVHATRAAIAEGVVPGGGVTLLYAAKALEKLKPADDEERVGIDIVRRALQAPVRQIVENAGGDGSIVVGKLLDGNDINRGYDAQKGEFADLLKAGIHRPGQGGAHRTAGRSLGRRPADHHRGADRREGGEEAGSPGRRRLRLLRKGFCWVHRW